MTHQVDLASVIGQNCRRLREAAGVSRNEVAKYARGVGLRWDTSKVRDFENGRNAPTFATVLAATLALSYATRTPVTLADLLTTPEGVHIVLTDQLAPAGSKVAAAANGAPLELDESDEFASLLVEVSVQLSKGKEPDPIDRIQSQSGLDEERLSRRLGVSADVLAAKSLQLWNQSFSNERDQRAGQGANPQKRGRVSRELQAELEREISRGDD